MKMHQRVLASLSLALPLAAQAGFGIVDAYGSAAQNPLLGMGPSWLENFEAAPVAGYSANAGTVLGSGEFIDSVDADDGSVDGFGTKGRSYYSNRASSIVFSFNSGPLGALPTAVGIAFTDVGFINGAATCGPTSAFMRVFDGGGSPIDQIVFSFQGDGSCRGETAEDVFVSWTGSVAVGSIEVGFVNSSDWEVDHLTAAVPEPGTYALMLLGLAAVAASAQRRRQRC